ncbi:hypothetical protein HPB52_008923 [Rhipicephalus sanguineus]|uniref:DUF7041 domain-containing protein n=1 Tax=Rhipicephalus sanguineus TaxID=34632 RepID=A0A9D4PQU2_RHISA|nr:hypothetical protein HPB52_008923 [Rhipicephalus sanguineus]
MLPRLCPPVPPFQPAHPRAWFMQLDACLAVNSVTAQPLMHDILLDALPAELRHLSAASSSSPQPYDDLCAAVLARYGELYRPLPGTLEFRVSPPPTRAVPPGPQPSHVRDLPSPAMSLSSSRPATSAAVPAPGHPPDEVPNVAADLDQSATGSFATLGRRSIRHARHPHVCSDLDGSRHLGAIRLHDRYLAARPEVRHGHGTVRYSLLNCGGFAIFVHRPSPRFNNLDTMCVLPAATSIDLAVHRS